jgi:hypothetical protein
MNFEFVDIGTISPIPVPASVEELAANVITDWMPGAPNDLARGFGELLSNILESVGPPGNQRWAVKAETACYEKQWRQATSWILGVALCRKVIEQAGYQWWAPVSAFAPAGRRSPWPWGLYWNTPGLVPGDCVVRRLNPKQFLPDYVVARLNSLSGTGQIAFVESKGCKDSLASSPRALPCWRQQAGNGEFICQGIVVPPAQQMVVATRVNPGASRTRTRHLYVRAWNTADLERSSDEKILQEIAAAHYFGVCHRLGMRANAMLLWKAALQRSDVSAADRRFMRILEAPWDRLASDAAQEVVRVTIRIEAEERGFMVSGIGHGLFALGESKVQLGLSEPAFDLIRSLQQSKPHEASPHGFLATFVSVNEKLRDDLKNRQTLLILSDGLVVRASTGGSAGFHLEA